MTAVLDSTRYRLIHEQLGHLTDMLLAGEVLLERGTAELFVRFIGAVESIHDKHRVDKHGHCRVCHGSRRSWWLWRRRRKCTVYSALTSYLGQRVSACS